LNKISNQAICVRFSCAYLIGKEDFAVRKFEKLIRSHLLPYGKIPKAYMDDHTALEMIKITSKFFRRRLRDRLKKTPYYGIMVDETTDKSTEQQLIIYIKYLDTDAHGRPTVVVEYLDLVSPLSGGAEDITVIVSFCQLNLVERNSKVITFLRFES
jgi:hypothetical protein